MSKYIVVAIDGFDCYGDSTDVEIRGIYDDALEAVRNARSSPDSMCYLDVHEYKDGQSSSIWGQPDKCPCWIVGERSDVPLKEFPKDRRDEAEAFLAATVLEEWCKVNNFINVAAVELLDIFPRSNRQTVQRHLASIRAFIKRTETLPGFPVLAHQRGCPTAGVREVGAHRDGRGGAPASHDRQRRGGRRRAGVHGVWRGARLQHPRQNDDVHSVF